MMKVFLDASVVVSACASVKGASALVLGLSKEGEIDCYVSPEVVGEARKNVGSKLGEKGGQRLKVFLTKANLSLVNSPDEESIAECEVVINVKDAPVLAAGKLIKLDYLLSLDKKHFFTQEVRNFMKPIKVVSPGKFINENRRILDLE